MPKTEDTAERRRRAEEMELQVRSMALELAVSRGLLPRETCANLCDEARAFITGHASMGAAWRALRSHLQHRGVSVKLPYLRQWQPPRI